MQEFTTHEAVGSTARPLKSEGFRHYCGEPHGCGKHFSYPTLQHGKPSCPDCGNSADYDPLPETREGET